MYRVSNDVGGLSIVLFQLVDALFASVTLLIMASIMLTRSVPLTVFAMSIVPLLLLANWLFARRIKDATEMAKAAEAAMNNSLIRTIIMVTHRTSATTTCDKVFAVSNGRVECR